MFIHIAVLNNIINIGEVVVPQVKTLPIVCF